MTCTARISAMRLPLFLSRCRFAAVAANTGAQRGYPVSCDAVRVHQAPSTGQETEAHTPVRVVHVEVDQDERLPGPEHDLAPQDRQRERWTHQDREEMVGAVAGGPVRVAVSVVSGKDAFERGDEVGLRPGSRLHHGEPCGGVRDECVHQSVTAVGTELGRTQS